MVTTSIRCIYFCKTFANCWKLSMKKLPKKPSEWTKPIVFWDKVTKRRKKKRNFRSKFKHSIGERKFQVVFLAFFSSSRSYNQNHIYFYCHRPFITYSTISQAVNAVQNNKHSESLSRSNILYLNISCSSLSLQSAWFIPYKSLKKQIPMND